MRPNAAFTMIEIVIALALAALMTVSVYSATNSATAVAGRQKQAAQEFDRKQRFLEILRRDLRGWIAVSAAESIPPINNKNNPPSSSEQSLLKFSTTADACSGAVAGGNEPAYPRSVTNLKYIVYPSLGGFEIQRIESLPDNEPSTLSVLRAPEVPKIEFFDGKNWISQWQKKDRPAAIRIWIEENFVYLRV